MPDQDVLDKVNFIMGLPRTVRVEGRFDTNTVYVNGVKLKPTKSLRIRNHSPTGFSWGYCGSGPAQLSLSILLLFMPEDKALEYYQLFKGIFVATLPQRDFTATLDLCEIIGQLEDTQVITELRRQLLSSSVSLN